ncbi:hypothetical protein GSI01S_21_00490 [Gordonia sihwensis NBRC 108236]|uniref:Uncharacterized protein n=1 Tax=Gordonia sihwensis NBRC 108236 TaxID=1223544 RepID=L7LM32_9ACTN|nr:hypothetical protein GSI01S_21_00490 [Gordonia sihwensis NBRC 108236]
MIPGPSPLARGAHLIRRLDGGSEGTIPARAGSTSLEMRASQKQWDHPRSRGEHPTQVALVVLNGGPSPLARGAHAAVVAVAAALGTIPARAGSTSGRVRRMSVSWDHPRSRGENHREG